MTKNYEILDREFRNMRKTWKEKSISRSANSNIPGIKVLDHNCRAFSMLRIVDHHLLSVTNMSNLSTKYVLSMHAINDVDNRCLLCRIDWNQLNNRCELDFTNFVRSVSCKNILDLMELTVVKLYFWILFIKNQIVFVIMKTGIGSQNCVV